MRQERKGGSRERRSGADCRLAVVSSCEMKLTAFGLQLDAINVSISDSCTMAKAEATARRAPAESNLDSQSDSDSHLDLAMAVAMAAAAAASRIWATIGFRDRLWIWISDLFAVAMAFIENALHSGATSERGRLFVSLPHTATPPLPYYPLSLQA